MRASGVLAALLLLVLAAGCGESGGAARSTTTAKRPATATSPDRAVVAGWADALRSGRIARADAYFDLPALVQSGGPPARLRTRAQVHAFDLGLPCGARLVRTLSHHGYLLAEFRLTERAGPGGGGCDGPGELAATAFLIRAGHIVEWRRIAGLPGSGASPTPPQPEAPPGSTPA